MSGTAGILPPTPYVIVRDATVEAKGFTEPQMIENVTGSTYPGAASDQESWGPNGPNQAIEFDEARNELIRKCFQGKAFSGVTRRLGRIKWS